MIFESGSERIYGTAPFTRAQKNAIGRALANMRLPGTWAVWQASFNNDRRFWLFDPCRLESWRKVASTSALPRPFSPAGCISTGRKRPSAGPTSLPNREEQSRPANDPGPICDRQKSLSFFEP
jgi:hypothetical protein